MDLALDITLLGSLSARNARLPESEPVTRFRTQKTGSLFAYLAFKAGRALPREELVDRFWPESEVDAGRSSLRTALAALRKDFGDALRADKASIMLSATTDLQRFEAALVAARNTKAPEPQRVERLREAVEAYGGPLLPGLYDDWILRERDRLEAEHRAALSALSRWHGALGEVNVALDYAHRAAAADPLSEEIRADLIRLLKQMGRPAEARRQFDDLERLLDEQLAEKPSDAVRALVTEINAQAVDAAPGEPARAVRLPVSRGRFRGRQDMLSALVQRLGGGRAAADGACLFTLFGPGGVGKTRLAIETARRLAAHVMFGEVWFVALATATTAEQIWESLLETLELTRSATVPAAAQIAARLERAGRALLVLDNLEQAALEGGEVAAALLDRAPGLTILTTSRRRLGAAGEELIPVSGLPTDESVGLFIDRARGVTPGFSPTDAEKEAIRKVVERVEGFPLAIELAAAWASVLTPSEMLAQLERGVLGMPGRTAGEERHLSLTATIRWSVDLLGQDLRQAFFALSIFRGGWDAAAAQTVSGVDRDALASLRDRSLITAQSQVERIRFGMHEALREFGESTLTVSERRSLADRHSAYFAALAESASHEQLTLEHANLQLALDSATGEQQRRMGLSLSSFWERQGHWREGRQVLERITADMSVESAGRDDATLVHALGRLCYDMCDYEASRGHHERALAIGERLGDDLGIARSYHALASVSYHHKPDIAQSRKLVESALHYFTRAGDAAGQASALIGMGVVATGVGDYLAARAYQQRSLEIAQSAGLMTEQGIAHWRLGLSSSKVGEFEEADRHLNRAEQIFRELRQPVNLAYVSVEQGALAHNRDGPGDREIARACYARALPIFRELGESWAWSICLGNLARLALAEGDCRSSAGHWDESLRIRVNLHDRISVATALDGIACLVFTAVVSLGLLELGPDAVRLRAAGASIRAELGLDTVSPEDETADEPAVRALVGAEACTATEAEGAELSQEEAVALAISCLESLRAR